MNIEIEKTELQSILGVACEKLDAAKLSTDLYVGQGDNFYNLCGGQNAAMSENMIINDIDEIEIAINSGSEKPILTVSLIERFRREYGPTANEK